MTKEQMNKDDLALALERSKKNIKNQASMALLAIVVTIVLAFALTVAWYSNILHTSDLTFQAKSWDFVFEGIVNINDGNTFMVAPGESGVLTLSVANTSDEANAQGQATDVQTIGVTANISKTDTEGIMQSRMYFYVDEETNRAGETVERQYLTQSDGYTYTIYPGNTLMISEDYYNASPIKWYWVQDVVGYYVRGKMTSNGLSIEEYIRPIEFDYTTASYDSDGNVNSVNGVEIDSYLKDNYLTKDGYSGSTINKYSTNHYKVDVNSENYGVWIYICNKEEIDFNNDLDSQLATLTGGITSFEVRIILTGQKVEEHKLQVGSSNAILNAVNDNTTNIIELTGNVTLEDKLIITEGKEKIVDLNGNTLTITDGSVTANEGSSISFINGTVTTEKDSKVFINATGANVYLDNLTVTGFQDCVATFDDESVEDSHIFISQSHITVKEAAVWLRGNGDTSASKTSVVIESSELISTEFVPVGGNGSSDVSGMNIQIMKSVLNGYYGGLFLPMKNSTTKVIDSDIIGNTAICIKGGTLIIEDCLVQSTGVVQKEPAHSGSGYTDTGDAIYIEDSYARDHGYEINVEINGEDTTVVSATENAIRVFESYNPTLLPKVSIVVNGGTFTSDVSAYLPSNNSKTITSTADNRWTVTDAPATN